MSSRLALVVLGLVTLLATSAHAVPEYMPNPGDPFTDDSFMENMGRKWGIKSREELAKKLVEAETDAERSNAWLLGNVYNTPMQVKQWRALGQRDPDDLEAAMREALNLMMLGDSSAAVRRLDATVGRTMVLRDERGRTSLQELRARHCSALWRSLDFTRAKEICQDAGPTGLRVLARIHLLEGHPELARPLAERAAAEKPDGAGSMFVVGVTRKAIGDLEGARAAWTQALRDSWTTNAAYRALNGLDVSIEDHFISERREEEMSHATDWANCGHAYLDLGLPDRAEPCFALAEKVEPGKAAAQRVVHLAETDKAAAMRQGERLLITYRHPDLLAVMAWLDMECGDSKQAYGRLKEALKIAPRNTYALAYMMRQCRLFNEHCDEVDAQFWEPLKQSQERGWFALVLLAGVFGGGVALLIVRMRRSRGARAVE